MVIDGYAKLLAFEGLFKKVSKEYETDLTGHVAERMKEVRDDIEQFNRSIHIATNTDPEQSKKSWHGLFQDRDILHFKENLIIDIGTIKPDEKAVEDHEEKLRKILGDF